MFWDGQYYGGHSGTPLDPPRAARYFAEGAQGFFDTYFLLGNPNTSAVSVMLTFLVEGGVPVGRTYAMPPLSRLTVFTGGIAELVGHSFGAVVDATGPVVAERVMYFGTPRFWEGGHASNGIAAPSHTWFLAEGATGSFFDTYVLVANPNAVPAHVNVAYMLENGTTVPKAYTVAAHSRLTINVEAQDPALATGASTAVSTALAADVPVVVERAMVLAGRPR